MKTTPLQELINSVESEITSDKEARRKARNKRKAAMRKARLKKIKK